VGHQFAETVMSGPLLLAIGVSVLAGLVSFISPCVLPLVPGYVGYVTGLTGTTLKEQRTRTVLAGVGLFVLGFAAVFVAFGTLFSAVGALLTQYLDIITRIMGIVVILAGVVFMGGFTWLQRDRHLGVRPAAGLWGAPLLGATFALGWAPCIGPTLAAVLTLSTSFGGTGSPWRGALLTFCYCLGLGIPFLVVAFLLSKGLGRLAWLRRHQRAIVVAGGVMLILLGIVLVSGLWNAWMARLQLSVGGFETVI
jgi:cytochrome c-type biogenesis protein